MVNDKYSAKDTDAVANYLAGPVTNDVMPDKNKVYLTPGEWKKEIVKSYVDEFAKKHKFAGRVLRQLAKSPAVREALAYKAMKFFAGKPEEYALVVKAEPDASSFQNQY